MNKQPIERSALLVIDAQDSFKAKPRWERRSNPDFERNVAALIGAWRAADLPVLFIMHTDEDGEFRRDSPYFKLMDFIERRENEPLLIKNTRNSFTSTDLQQRLTALGVTRIVVTGIQTEQCCETTTRIGADLGYDVDFVTEATRTFPLVNWETGEEYDTDSVTRHTEWVLRGRFARIVKVSDLVAELEGALAPSNR
ncbi:MAG TPA: isochorismatase family protein [Thermoanaerobaculia bacterium]|jgi:nicotinamidase-related amidase|nr:isochorismatase family protein [Thermoanaerobaculia bacterium]